MLQVLNQEINLSILTDKQISLFIKREDQIHPFISGNKYRKLKYNILEAQHRGETTLLTFGGAYSNHIAATAYAGKIAGLKTIGVIRGEELVDQWRQNPTLRMASEQGMEFQFITRNQYRDKTDDAFLEKLKEAVGPCYIIPEGGTNALAVKGCAEILTSSDMDFDVVCSSAGTGGTLAGIIEASDPSQKILGFPALKGDFLKKDICKFVTKENWELITDYHFGGYAKVTESLVNFINNFKDKTGVPLDPVYTGKLLYGIIDLVQRDYFSPGTKILAIHSGGLQGIEGMNLVLKKKNLPLLKV
ncbi:1-aminocyclopropane-1-carboxylate deaminase/D-cysteine desulfhydrase [Arenibacter sp. 6A1]|uniref:1-aminocyclopropane-1-carboxylate deaminase/D-cysteine desulfhydrase n=1 Tax=Arenibacter sp. 6A1 TaxID=2720391 RepID=UPI001445C339|nr:pyridoxal-phosphate dependent enzyme [Arenibacter sp. 6A1]NKI26000.1 1-aminocyclopropane-1-carboxylate deaminase/D-cysteine desulfhydrase [Arenibacter sp. 6A1]